MKAEFTTKRGNTVRLEVLNHGHRVTDETTWQIYASARLEHDEVEEIIESEYPAAGYGTSNFTRFPEREGVFTIRVTSFSSCD